MIVHFIGYGHCACPMPMPPGVWPEGHRWSNDWMEVSCSECLKGKDPIDTFTIENDVTGKSKSITCKRCGKTSYNPKDIEYRYCGHCHAYHDDIWPPARHWWINTGEANEKRNPSQAA